jgi:glycosyltransferase involved in cell wall biosynthesis
VNPVVSSATGGREELVVAAPGPEPAVGLAVDGAAKPVISIVVPFYNEEANVVAWHKALSAVLGAMALPYEIIAIDDGSRDTTFARLRELHLADPHLKVVRFRRNFGQTAALSAGFDHAVGDVIVTMDGDLQNHPEDIPRLLSKLDEGYDIVSGWRVKRQDAKLTRILPSRIANALISSVTGVRLHDYGCSLKAYRSEVVKGIRLYGDLHRFIPAVASYMGTAVAELPVEHSPRRAGKSKYGLWRTVRVLLDLVAVRFLLSFLTKPIQVFGLLGLICGGLGALLALYLGYLKVFLGESIGDRPLLMLAGLLIIIGVQFVVLGLLGEVLTRVYYEVQGKHTYVVREMLGLTNEEP